MDNNFGERAVRGPANGRKPGFGSDSMDGDHVHGTVARSGLDVLRWRLRGERRPGDLSPWLP